MASHYDYGNSFEPDRPGASRRLRGADIRSREFGAAPNKNSSVDSMRHSQYANYTGDSNRLNRSTSGSRQYSYKLDQIQNKLANNNNPVLSFYKEKNQSRISTGERNNDSSNLKRNIENYEKSQLKKKNNHIKPEKDYERESTRSDESQVDSRRSTRGQMTYSRGMMNSRDNLMQTSANKRAAQKHLDVIYEDPYGQSDDLDPRQKEILEKYYLQSRRNLRPSQRKMKTPMMTPDNNIRFLDNGSMIKNPKPTRTPPPPMWGEESEVDETAGEPFYDPENDPARNSRTLLHLDSSRSKRQQFFKDKLKEQDIDTETVVIHDKRPKGSKLKKKIVYVYDSDSDDDNQHKLPPMSKRSQASGYGIKTSDQNRSYIGSQRSNYSDMAYSKRVDHNRSSDIGPSKAYRDIPSR
jgi:hypothetical protein